MALIARSTIRTSIFQRANLEDNDEFLTDTEMDSYINYAIRDLYDHILDSENAEVFVKNAPILTKQGDFSFTLPSDFYKLRDVSFYDNGEYYKLKKADASDWPQLTTNPPTQNCARYLMRYKMDTDVWCLVCFPDDLTAANLAVMYIPEPPVYTTDEQTIGFMNGWEDYVILQCAIWAKEKEMTDPSALMAELAEIKQDISSHASYMDAGRPTTIRKLENRRNDEWK